MPRRGPRDGRGPRHDSSDSGYLPGYFGHGDVGSQIGPSSYNHPFGRGGRSRSGRNGRREDRDNVNFNDSSIAIMNDDGTVRILHSRPPVYRGGGHADGGGVSVMNNGHGYHLCSGGGHGGVGSGEGDYNFGFDEDDLDDFLAIGAVGDADDLNDFLYFGGRSHGGPRRGRRGAGTRAQRGFDLIDEAFGDLDDGSNGSDSSRNRSGRGGYNNMQNLGEDPFSGRRGSNRGACDGRGRPAIDEGGFDAGGEGEYGSADGEDYGHDGHDPDGHDLPRETRSRPGRRARGRHGAYTFPYRLGTVIIHGPR